MQELVTNIHIHSHYSDGSASHQDIANAAISASLDVIIVTDHNVSVKDTAKYIHKDIKKVLLLIGQEVNDQTRTPQKNHLVVLGINQNLNPFAQDPQKLITRIRNLDGLSFIAHPFDPTLKFLKLEDISWTDWEMDGFTGIEIWNGMSEMKSKAHSMFKGFFYTIFPNFIAEQANPQALAQWDSILSRGRRIIAIGGSDAHAFQAQLGPFKFTVLPFSYHFKAINNHILTPSPLTGDPITDSKLVLDALRRGHFFIGYDLPHPTRGFRFSAASWGENAMMGDSLSLQTSVTFQIRLPLVTECSLLKDGRVIQTWSDQEFCTFITDQPGSYRVECYLDHFFRRRAWIYSNPITVLPVPQKSRRV
jgi:hypothetical protein